MVQIKQKGVYGVETPLPRSFLGGIYVPWFENKTWIYTCASHYVYVCIHVYAYVCMYVCMYMYMYICICTHIWCHDSRTGHEFICVHLAMYMNIYMYVYMYMCMYVNICICISTHTQRHNSHGQGAYVLFSNINESCRTRERVMAHTWIRHVPAEIYVYICICIYTHTRIAM